MITYSEAQAKVARSRSGYAKLMANTYIHATAGNAYAVRYHSTDIITIRDDGTYSLSTGGWNTVTTWRRINEYGPASVSSVDGTPVVWSRNDPKTPPKIQRCRHCHGTGILHTAAYTESRGILDYDTFEVVEDHQWNTVRDGKTYPDIYVRAGLAPLVRDGEYLASQPHMITVPGLVKRIKAGTWTRLPVPVFHPSEPYACHWDDAGPGLRDYGSKGRPVIFHDGITVDMSGEVTDPAPERMFPTPGEIAARAAERERQARLYERRNRDRLRRERAAWLADYGLTERNGRITVYKAVGDDLRADNHAPGAREAFQYPIGETVTAPDWQPIARCGNGLHFGPDPRVSQGYYRDATRFLACSVLVRGMQVIGDKIKVQSAKVLYEVGIDGNRI